MLPSAYAPLQNGTDWQVWITRDSGERLATITRTVTNGIRAIFTEYTYANTSAAQAGTGDTAVSFEYTQALNNVGWFKLELPGGFDRTVLRKDNRVVFWRKPVGGAGYIAFMGFIRKLRTRQ